MAKSTALTKQMYGTRFYYIYHNMKKRCDNILAYQYKNYGGRGIKYAATWSTLEGFYEDMYSSYDDNLTLDRIDCNSNYSKSNCRWATMKEQQNNRRNNRRITIDGVTNNLCKWIELSGLKPSTVKQRFYVYNWPIKKALGKVGYLIG